MDEGPRHIQALDEAQGRAREDAHPARPAVVQCPCLFQEQCKLFLKQNAFFLRDSEHLLSRSCALPIPKRTGVSLVGLCVRFHPETPRVPVTRLQDENDAELPRPPQAAAPELSQVLSEAPGSGEPAEARAPAPCSRRSRVGSEGPLLVH